MNFWQGLWRHKGCQVALRFLLVLSTTERLWGYIADYYTSFHCPSCCQSQNMGSQFCRLACQSTKSSRGP